MFQSDTWWDVDKAAELLNTSLFGKPRKKRKSEGTTVQNSAKGGGHVFSSVIRDSDDETFTKKGKKKLKEKRRRKNKLAGKPNSETLLEKPAHHDKRQNGTGMSYNSKKNKHDVEKIPKQTLKLSRPDMSFETDASGGSLKDREKKKQKAKVENSAERGYGSIQSGEIKKRKRKKSISEHSGKDGTVSKAKKMKIDQNANSEAIVSLASEDGKRKRKRKRKKKNNSKKNKYKHLALNSKDKALDSSTSEHIENTISKKLKNQDSPHSKEKSTLSKVSLGHKSPKKVSQSSQIPNLMSANSPGEKALTKQNNQQQMKTVNNIPHDVLAEGQGGHETSEKAKSHLMKMKTTKKRKHDQTSLENMPSQGSSIEDGLQPPMKKMKKKKTKKKVASGDNVPERSPQPQVVSSMTENKTHNIPVSKTAQKTKLKQHILVKMLDGLQRNKSGPPAEKKSPELTSKKRKKLKQKEDNENDASEIRINLHKVNPKHKETKANSAVLKDSKDKNEKKKAFHGHEIMTDLNGKPSSAATSTATASLWGKAAELGQQARDKLDSARFRYINEQLYSCDGSEALRMFREDKEAFSVYHQGFENQVSRWPVNPLKVIIKQIKEKPGNLVIADFGCGDAKLAQSVPHKVHSFDLVALNKRVTVCDMSKTPLPNEKVDIAVFCLSLMGTNISDYIHEASRILKTGGLLKIAEVVSRFSGLSRFIDGVCSHGFELLNKRDLSQMFYLMDFRKVKTVKKSVAISEIKLKPCVYKRR